MDDKTAAALAKRLAAYSATAGVTLAITPASGAQVVYYDLDPDITVASRSDPDHYVDIAPLDFDGDGVADVSVVACYYYDLDCYQRGNTYRVTIFRPRGLDAPNGALGYPHPDRPSLEAASRLSAGDVIGPPGSGQDFYPYAIAASRRYGGVVYCPFVGQRGYAGFRFVAGDGHLHYGWLRLGVTDGVNKARVYDFAYETALDTPILAGDTGAHAPAVLLDGTVNQTVFPPEGGTLTFTATVTNTTDEPRELDLWAIARRPDSTRLGVRRFGSAVVPAGGSLTRTVSARIPAGAPAGTAEVRFHVGRFPAVADSETFSITKEPGAHATEAGNEATFFAEDDTSATAAASAEAHGLSAPSPNPASGRTELTLTVAEAQSVRVEVLDALGRRVALLHDGPLAAGIGHRLAFDGSTLPAGVYVVRAVGETFADARVLTLTR